MTERPRILPAVAMSLLLVAAGTLPPQDDPFVKKVLALIEQVNSREHGKQKFAEDELCKLGLRALAIVRQEEAGLKTGELKTRLKALIARMEHERRKAVARGQDLLLTLSAKDRPVPDLLAELQKLTSVPIDHQGIASDAVSSLEASGLTLWEAVDQVCKANGKLVWDVTEKGISVRRGAYARPFMAVTLGYAAILRRFDRNPPGPGTGGRDYLSSAPVVVGAPGATSVSQVITFSELVDDKGTDLLNASAGLSVMKVLEGYHLLDDPDTTRPFHEIPAERMDPAPARSATKVKSCKGVVTVRAVVEMKKLVEIPERGLKPGTRMDGGALGIRIETIDLAEASARMEIDVIDSRLSSRKEKKPYFPEIAGRVILRDSSGREVKATLEKGSVTTTPAGPTGPARETTRFKVSATLQPKTPLVALELWEPSEVEEVKINFEFKDVPMKKPK